MPFFIIVAVEFSHICSFFADEPSDDFEHTMSPDGLRSHITQPSSATSTASSSSLEIPSGFSTDRPTTHKRNHLPDTRTQFGSRIPARTVITATVVEPPSTSLSTTSASDLTSTSSPIPTSVGDYEVHTTELHADVEGHSHRSTAAVGDSSEHPLNPKNNRDL